MRVGVVLAVVCIACRTPGHSHPSITLSDAERAAAGCYRVLHWDGPAAVIPTSDVFLDSASVAAEQPSQRRWRPLPRTPSGRANAIWATFRDSVEVLLLEPQPDRFSTGYGGRLGVRGDTLAGRLEPLSDFKTVTVDESGHRPALSPNFRAVRVPCATPPREPPGT